MALELENIDNLVTDDLDLRNRNWTTIDDSLELKADLSEVESHLADDEIHRKITIGYDEPLNPIVDDIWLDLNPERVVLADWRMNETTGTIIQDYSGNGYHATAKGGVTITDPINELSAKSRTGDGLTGYIETQFNGLYGLTNFKVEAFFKMNDVTTVGWKTIINNYRTPEGVSVGFHLSHNIAEIYEESYGIGARIYTTEGFTDGTPEDRSPLYSGIVAVSGQVYKAELEYDGSLATLKIYEVSVNDTLTLVYSGSQQLAGLMNSNMQPLAMLANRQNEDWEELNDGTIGRIRITTLAVH